MPIICPKCQHVRPADTSAPDWQCPACGVAYVKAAEAANAARRPAPRPVLYQSRPERGIAWGKWIAVLAVLAYGAWAGFRLSSERQADTGDYDMPALAASVKAEDVVMYTTSTCGYCAQAKRWLRQNGFAFTECNVETDRRCEAGLRATGSVGVPTLLVRGQLMDNGFDSDEFLALLQQ
jgi:glutaredoxin